MSLRPRAVKVFLSYRRTDSAPWAGRLGDALAARYGSGNVLVGGATLPSAQPLPDDLRPLAARQAVLNGSIPA